MAAQLVPAQVVFSPSIRPQQVQASGGGVLLFVSAGLPALQGGEPGQVRKEAAITIYCECRGKARHLFFRVPILCEQLHCFFFGACRPVISRPAFQFISR